MNAVILLLFVFVSIGLARDHLGRFAYLLMGLAIVIYISYAYQYGG